MGAIRSRCASVALVAVTVLPVGALDAREPLRDAPVVWYDDDRRDIEEPEEREPSLFWEGPRAAFLRPLERYTRPSDVARKVGKVFGGSSSRPAQNVNALGEVPSSSWFTNRIGLFPMSVEACANGSGPGTGPSTDGVWTIVSAKTEGVTPGFNVRDANGDLFLIKFDSPENPNVATAAGAIAARIFHAAGYNAPDDTVVYFTRDRLVLGDDVQLKLPGGERRSMTEEDIDGILEGLSRTRESWRAISSRFLSGKPVGPFDYMGTRHDDPNDDIPHEHRRELRGLYTFAAWLSHFDTKQHNTLDMYVEENGRRFVKHHLIDFASTLGTGAKQPTHRWGYEYTVDLPPLVARMGALGFKQDAWRRLERPEGLWEVGMWESEVFDPREFKPLNPNTAFAHQTKQDAYWAAKIISAFTDEHLLAITQAGQYEEPEATRYVARILAERRDKIARTWFDEVPPLDFFRFDGELLTYRDLGAERGIYPGTTPRYESRVAAVDADRGVAEWSSWTESRRTRVELGSGALAVHVAEAPVDRYPFTCVEVRVDRGDGYGSTIRAYVARGSGRVVAVDR